ncbi:MAG: hypothetical protein AB7V26_10935 [Lysobacterales bacterium]
MNPKHRHRLLLIVLVLAFAAPMLIASLLQRGGWMPSGRKNYGELLSPPLPMPAARLHDGGEFAWKTPQWYWTLLVRVPSDCAADCRQSLLGLPKLRQSLDRHATQLRIAIVDEPGRIGTASLQGQGIYAVRIDASERIDPLLPDPLGSIQLALVDPNGFMVLRFPPSADFERVRRDLKRLIR